MLLWLCISIACALQPFELDLPRSVRVPHLPWQPRADWISVTTYGATGLGVADDTVAVAQALAVVAASSQGAGNKTLFFPPGIFLISATLHIRATLGIMIVGCGRATVLRWTGPCDTTDGSRLLWSDGNTRAHFEGLVFDGNGCGYVGLDHDSHTLYESRVVHRHLLFMNWMLAGVRTGHNQTVAGGIASAEMLFENVAFANNTAGAVFQAWNDYVSARRFRVLGACPV